MAAVETRLSNDARSRCVIVVYLNFNETKNNSRERERVWPQETWIEFTATVKEPSAQEKVIPSTRAQLHRLVKLNRVAAAYGRPAIQAARIKQTAITPENMTGTIKKYL